MKSKEKENAVLLEYFEMLRTYVAAGYLEVLPVASEAYITRAGIHALAGTDTEIEELDKLKRTIRPGQHDVRMDILSEAISEKFLIAARGILSYVCWIDANEEGYKQFMQAMEFAADSPYSRHTAEQTGENLRRMRDASDQVVLRMQKKAIAIHVVADSHPHDLFYTIYYQRKRNLILPWKEKEHLEIINYRR